MSGMKFRDPSDLQTLDHFLCEEGFSAGAEVCGDPSDLATAALERRPTEDASRPAAVVQDVFLGRVLSPSAHMFRGTMQ
jgi:hypothetical protein